MLIKTRSWQLVAGGLAAGIAGVVGLGGTTAYAEPAVPQPVPAPVTITQTVTAAPAATADSLLGPAPAASAQSGTLPGTVPAAVAPGLPAAALPAAAAAPAPAPAPVPALVPATSGTLVDFLKGKGVTLEPQTPRDFRALNITLPVPGGWTLVPTQDKGIP